MISSKLVNIVYKSKDLFPEFLKKIQDLNLVIICDENTEVYADKYILYFEKAAKEVKKFVFEKGFIANETAIEAAKKSAKAADYLLAVGSGTINDLCKYIAKLLSIPMGVLPTAPSMDGYLSTGSALIINKMKVTEMVLMPEDILIDLDILASSPREMIIAGYGDIIGKFTALADWRLANIYNGEKINQESYDMMARALKNTISNIEKGDPFSKDSIECLIDALNTAGIAMAVAGNSRPASGSEHHISHFLEIHFINNNLPPVLHGIKVGLGCLVTVYLYKSLLINVKNDAIIELINSIPDYGTIYTFLEQITSPLRFQEINVDKNLFREAVYNAHSMRDRFTILTYYQKHNLYDLVIEDLYDKFL